MRQSSWQYSTVHKSVCKIVEEQTLWGQTICRVWFPGNNSVIRIPKSNLKSIQDTYIDSSDSLIYIAAAAKVADALTQDVLLAPIESSVIPLPHQIRALSRAVTNDRVRYLLADEVGLGKTIEAGLILKELKLRGLVKRILVIAPKGLVTQWVSEMQIHFAETFQLVLPDDIKTLKRITSTTKLIDKNNDFSDTQPANAWQMFSQLVVPMDSVKPLEKRRGWNLDQITEYNRERFEDLISAGWDLVIVDEAHRLGGSTDQVARFKLGQGLSEAAPYLLLLSATPHQGKTDAFHRLVSLIDSHEFPDISSVTRERVHPYVIRTEKRMAIDAEGKPLFKPRRTQLISISWEERHYNQQILYKAVTEYVREGYNQAIREKRSYIGFLMILMQRLVVSSTKAIRTTLEKRLDVLSTPDEQLTLFSLGSEDEWSDLDGQEQIELLLKTNLKSLKNERAEVKLLLEAAARCEKCGPDAKAESLLEWIYRLQSEENDPDLKVLIFTEFVPTQEMLRNFLVERGFSVVCLNGSMNMEERIKVQESFANDDRILISTDAGGEGLNLQFCHVVINYDIPWNPMRLEQRIGRVDRIGQSKIVQAINFVFEDSVEHRVREVLEEKLNVIFDDLGIDKTSDVLDSAEGGQIFDEMFVDAILNPEKVNDSVNNAVTKIRDQILESRSISNVLGATEDLKPDEAQRLQSHPLPHWVERMTLSYLKSNGGKVEKNNNTWNLTWPNNETHRNIVFTNKDAEKNPTAKHLTLEEPKIRGLAMRIPQFVPGQPIPVISISGITEEIKGFWALWRISISTLDWNRRSIIPLFLSDSGKVFLPTARHIWDQILVSNPIPHNTLTPKDSMEIFSKLEDVAEEYGKPIYEELLQKHKNRLFQEREKTEYAFSSRRKAIERIGLPQVRNYRIKILEDEIKTFQEQYEQKLRAIPDIVPLLIVRVEENQ